MLPRLIENGNTKKRENEDIWKCETCDFKCRYKSDYTRHLSTAKHKKATYGNIWQQSTTYVCECGRAYTHRASLYKYKKVYTKKREKREKQMNNCGTKFPSKKFIS